MQTYLYTMSYTDRQALGVKQYYNILQFNIYYCNTIQYDLQKILVYCYITMFVVFKVLKDSTSVWKPCDYVLYHWQ